MATVDDLERKAGIATAPAASTGPGLVWDASVELVPLGLGWDAHPVVLDWFGRGAPDLLLSAGGGPAGRVARIYQFQPQKGSSPAHYDAGTEVEGLDGLRFFCPIANGTENRFDLVALGEEGLVLLCNQGHAHRPEFGSRQPLGVPADLGTGTGRVVHMVNVDWDGDGLTDLLAALEDLNGYWPDGSVPREQQVGFNQRGGHPGYDRSGRWRGRAPQSHVFCLRNVGRLGEPRFEIRGEISTESGGLDLAPRPAALAIAWGGQGAWELLVTDCRGELRLYRNFGGQRPPVLLEPRLIRRGGQPFLLPDDRAAIVVADVDTDQRAELVYGTSDGRVFAVHAGGGRDEALAPVPLLHESRSVWLGGHAVVAAGDLDADGDLDLVVGDAAGRVHLVRDLGAPGDHRYALPVALEAGGEPFRVDPGPDGVLEGPVAPRNGYSCPALADWSGHGRLDLIIGGAGGEICFLRNNGTRSDPRFDVPKMMRCEGAPLIVPPRVRPATADWLGSGKLDLIALDLQGVLCVYPRSGLVELHPPVPLVDRLGRLIRLDGGFGQAGRCALWAGPWTGSGHIDILVGLPRGTRYVIPPLIGQHLGDPDELPTVLLLENQGRGELVARPLLHADGRPVVVGTEGCSPCGVDGSGQGRLDLLVGSDDGRLHYFRREDLCW